jgi:threonine dehydratase
MKVHQWVVESYSRIKEHIRETPLEYSPYLSSLCECNVYLKLENQQITGSFKVRGALNKILGLSAEQTKQGIVTASTGNHAAAVGYALDIAGAKGEIFMPENVADIKVQNLAQYKNVKVNLFGSDSVDAEREAIKQAGLTNRTYVSPYNDEQIVGGQGTVAYEIINRLPTVNHILVPVGGGGLVSGIGGYVKTKNQNIEVIGCQPVNSAVMYHSIKSGNILNMESKPTISDGTAGGIEPGSITFPLCQKYVDEFHLLTEDEILAALGILVKHHQHMAEGAAGLSVAGLIKHKRNYKGQNVVLIICGNKMDIGLLGAVLSAQT